MQLSPLQIAVLAVIAGFFVLWLVAQRKRRGQTWESLLTRLNPSLNGRAVSEYFPWKEGLSATPDEVWDNMHGLKGVFTIYRNAQVMLDIADFVYRNYEGVDLALVAGIRSDAMQIRSAAMATMLQWMLSNATESVRTNAFRVMSMYTGMTARMTELLQANANVALPAFVAAA